MLGNRLTLIVPYMIYLLLKYEFMFINLNDNIIRGNFKFFSFMKMAKPKICRKFISELY